MFSPTPSRDKHFPGCSDQGAAWVIPVIRMLFASATVLVAMLCLLPAADISQIGLGDKVEHVAAYALLTLLGVSGCRSRPARLGVVVFLFFFGLLLEALQAFVPGRSADIVDILANMGGMVGGSLLRMIMGRMLVTGARVTASKVQSTPQGEGARPE